MNTPRASKTSNSIIIGGDVSNSTISNIQKASGDLFSDMYSALSNIKDGRDREKLHKLVAAMELRVGEPGFLEKYKDFIQVAANHMSILSPFLPALSKLIS